MQKLRTILTAYFQTRRRTFGTREELRAYQDQRVQAFLQWVAPRSPYTQERFGGQPLRTWRELAPIGKTEMMANFTALNTVGLDRDRALSVALQAEESRDFQPELGGLTVGLSSGTSGHRGLFVVSPQERWQWAGTILAKLLPDPLFAPRRDRVAFFLRANSNLYETTRSLRVQFSFFDLIEELDHQVDRLSALNPTIVVAPPSVLRRIGQRQRQGTLHLQPRRIISVAEPLDPLDDRQLRATFLQPIHQVYQATEGFLGHTCAWGTLHLNEDLVVFQQEPLDALRFVPVITDFRRRSQPMIRYRLNDVLRRRPVPCRCGSPLLAIDEIEGRCDDVFYGAKRDGGYRPIYADFIRRAVLRADGRITDYGVRQQALDRLEVFAEMETDTPIQEIQSHLEGTLQAMFQRMGCHPPQITFIDSWPKGGMRKRKRVERVIEAPL